MFDRCNISFQLWTTDGAEMDSEGDGKGDGEGDDEEK